MPVDFRDYFWGEGNNGFDVLYHNMKYGHGASKELAEFFRERSVIEETHSKLLAKLAKHASNCCAQGTFAPFWKLLKTSSEKLSTLHAQMVQRFQDLVKEVNKYCDEQHRTHKQVKEDESSTLEVVQCIQQTTISLHKAKEMYNSRCLEFEKLKRENASLKEVEKAETKCKKACDEYKSYVEKYGMVRDDFQNKMTVSCQNFQRVEEKHLKRMKTFLSTYAQVLESGHALIGQIHVEFKQQCNDMELDKLLEQFVSTRGTGPDRPGPLFFEEADLSSLGQIPSPETLDSHNEERSNKKEGKKMSLHRKSKPSRRTTSLLDLFFSSSLGNGDSSSTTSYPSLAVSMQSANDTTSSTENPSNSDSLTRTTLRASKWFLKSKRERRKDKKKKKLNGNKAESTDTSTEIERNDAEPNTPHVDAEGFTIIPFKENRENDKDSFYSSSDAESDNDEIERKIHVEIKPLNGTPMSASVDELRATIGSITLSPVSQHTNRRIYSSVTSTPEDGPMKRSISASQPISKTDSDVFSLFSPTASSASTPTGIPGIIQSPTSVGSSNIIQSDDSTPTANNRYAALSEIFAEATQAETQISETGKGSQNGSSRGSTPTSIISLPTSTIAPPLLPRPPSRKALESSSRGRMSPLPNTMTRTESIGSLTNDFKTTSMPVGSSRGPSPLTIGMSDTIPLAVAFQEVVHAYFRGADETKCQVRLMGDMKVSFPAGIVQVLANNPSPATLSFKVIRSGRLENILPNKQLIIQDTTKTSLDHIIYDFNMPALTSLLRKQYEQTPNASYFNIDILKYHIKSGPGATSTPFHLVAYWKCEPTTTDIRIDYKYHPVALASPASITNINIIVPVDGSVIDMQSKPPANWNSETNRASWRIPELSNHSEGGGLGSLRARFDLVTGPSIPSVLAAQFVCQGTSLSGAEFELVGSGYRLSLVKKQVVAGKYLCEADQNNYA